MHVRGSVSDGRPTRGTRRTCSTRSCATCDMDFAGAPMKFDVRTSPMLR